MRLRRWSGRFVNAPIGWGAYWSGITCSTRWLRQLSVRAPPAAGAGFGSLPSRTSTARAPLAHAIEKRWQGGGEGSYSARGYRAGAGDLLPPEGPEASGQALRRG